MSGEPIDGAATGGFPIGEVIGLAIAVLLLVAVLRNLRAARNALGAAFAGIGFGFGALMWAAAATDVPGLAPTLGGMLGLGAGIDYALLMAARQQEELRAGRSPIEAAQRTNATAGHSALTAAGIVLVSISGLLVTGIPFVGRAGVAAGLVVLACAIVCVVLLPARFARAGRKLLPRASAPSAPCARPRTPRAPWATKRPVLALVAAGAVIVALAAPAAGLELGQPDDRNLTTDTTQRQAYDRLAAGLRRRRQRAAGRRRLASADDDGAGRARPSACRPTARSPTSPLRRSTRPRHGRDHGHAPPRPAGRAHPRARGPAPRRTTIPAALHDTGATAYVGGRTARYGDEADKIASRIPLFAAAVVGLSLLLLLAAFRSWRISVLSAVFNLASIAAAYGVVALAFQTATGASLLGDRAAARRPVRAAVHVRDPVRALDGLQRVPALARAGGVGPPREPPRGDRGRVGQHAQDRHRRGRDHDRRLPRLRDRPRPGDQDDRRRARHRGARGRHAGPAVHGPGGAHAARRPAVAEPSRPPAARRWSPARTPCQ